MKPKSKSKKDKVLEILQRRKNGAYNYQLNPITFRYGDCIFELRKEGYVILTEAVDIHQGLYKYILVK